MQANLGRIARIVGRAIARSLRDWLVENLSVDRMLFALFGLVDRLP
jgi:hypothetical protein